MIHWSRTDFLKFWNIYHVYQQKLLGELKATDEPLLSHHHMEIFALLKFLWDSQKRWKWNVIKFRL